MSNKSAFKGILWMVSHGFCLAMLTTIAKKLSHLPSYEIVFLENLVVLLLCLPFVARKYKSILHTRKWHLHVTRAALGVISVATFFTALRQIPVADAMAINFLQPLLTAVLAVFFFKERMAPYKVVAIAISFVGMLIILRPGTEVFNPAALLVLAAVAMWSLNALIIKIMGKTENTLAQTWYLALFAALFSLPMAYENWVTPSPEDLIWLVFLGAVFTVNVFSIFNAFYHADIVTLQPFSFSNLIFAIVLSYIFFNEVITWPTIIGACIIFGSNFYMLYQETKTHAKVKHSYNSDI